MALPAAFNAREYVRGRSSWVNAQMTRIKVTIPFTANNIKTIGHELDCDCDANCVCHWNGKESSCPCCNNNAECRRDCGGCKKVRRYGKSDNTQIQRMGLFPKRVEAEFINKIIGSGLKAKQNIDVGDVIICFTGEVKEYCEIADDNRYCIQLGHGVFELKQSVNSFQKGDRWESAQWVLDSSSFGCDANYINSSCDSNNSLGLKVYVDGIPIVAVYAVKPITSGVLVCYVNYMMFNYYFL